jgi:phosphoribosylanthranilate isomerase
MFVKICGVTTIEDALLAAGLGADAVGMIFAASARRITSAEARDIARRLPPSVWSVGVFRNERREKVAEIANTLGLRAVQLHGNESPTDTSWVAQRVPVVIKAFAATDPDLARADEYGADLLLVDSATPGSGKLFDWAVLEEAPMNRPFLLAGGLDPANVVDAARTVRPWGVDVASGVETSPGRKDPAKVRQFIAAAKSVPEAQRSDYDLDSPERPFNWEEDATWR